jgi:ribosome maturation factor RimP
MVEKVGQDIVATVEGAVEPVLGPQGYEVWLTEFLPRSRVLRMFIDHPSGVSLEDCTRVSHLISDLLDAEGYSDLFGDGYTLEVSSPGLDRRLVKPEHFRRFVGRMAQVRTLAPADGQRKFRGELVAANEEGIRIDIDGQARELEYEQIESARLVPDL